MKHKLAKIHPTQAILLALAIILLILLVMPSTAHAQSPPAATPPGGTLEQRVAQRKAERNIVIEERDQKRLENTCINGQNKLRALQNKTTPIVTNRTKVYQQIDAKLWITIGRLKLAGKDTFNLEKQRAELAQKSATFQTTAQAYRQSLDDTTVLNCKADLVGFKAMLETARLYRIQLRDQSTGLRNYVVNDIKPTLNGFATDLQAKPATEGQN